MSQLPHRYDILTQISCFALHLCGSRSSRHKLAACWC